MILIEIKGGLGNQLFQIFCGIHYSIEYDMSFTINENKRDKVSLLDHRSPRPTYFDHFLNGLSRHLYRDSHMISSTYIYNEPSFLYNKIPYKDNLMINGYFQSPKYFEKHYKEITNLIQLEQQKLEIKNKYKDYFDYDGKTISMHFRIGDYIKKPDVHLILNTEYYIHALKCILEKDNDCKYVLYFNEEQDNVQVTNIIHTIQKEFSDVSFIQCSYTIQDWKQMLLMSNCDHNIIANSTFSWWGAYFNSNNSKMVCYPNTWFGHDVKNSTKDLFPDDWIKILSIKLSHNKK